MALPGAVEGISANEHGHTRRGTALLGQTLQVPFNGFWSRVDVIQAKTLETACIYPPCIRPIKASLSFC